MNDILSEIMASHSHDKEELLRCQLCIEKKNFPLAEIYLRRHLVKNISNRLTVSLLQKIREGYGITNDFILSESSTNKHPSQRYMLIKSWGYGFWSDVHHVLSQLLICELTNRIPIIHWGSNCLFTNIGDESSFSKFFKYENALEIHELPKHLTIYPSKWNRFNLFEENNNKWSGANSRMAGQFFFNRSEELVVSDFYSTLHSIIPWIDKSSAYYNLDESVLYGILFQKYIKVSEDIEKNIDTFFSEKMRGREWVAVHVRGSDKINESPHLSFVNQQYFPIIDNIISNNPSLGIFLLTDSEIILKEFHNKYGSRVLTTSSHRSNNHIGVHMLSEHNMDLGIEVLVDSFLAVRCQIFIGNIESNVSLAISSLKKWNANDLILKGVQNIRGENAYIHNID